MKLADACIRGQLRRLKEGIRGEKRGRRIHSCWPWRVVLSRDVLTILRSHYIMSVCFPGSTLQQPRPSMDSHQFSSSPRRHDPASMLVNVLGVTILVDLGLDASADGA